MQIAIIKTMEDVRAFIKKVMFGNELIMGFHPDNSFSDYVNDKGEPLFTPEKAKELNIQMEQSFDVCTENGEDIYEIANGFVKEFYQNEKKAGRPVPPMFEDEIHTGNKEGGE